MPTPIFRAWISCSTGSSAHRDGSLRRSTRRRSICPRCERLRAIREEARSLAQRAANRREPDRSLVGAPVEAARREKSIFETSSMLAISPCARCHRAPAGWERRLWRVQRGRATCWRRRCSNSIGHAARGAGVVTRHTRPGSFGRRSCRRLAIRAREARSPRAFWIATRGNPHESTTPPSLSLRRAVCRFVDRAQGPPAAAAASAEMVTPGELVIEPPRSSTLASSGSSRATPTATPRSRSRIRKAGATAWKSALPLLRQGERIYAESRVDVIAPNMFAGSVLDLEPDTS